MKLSKLKIAILILIVAVASISLGWYPHKSASKPSTTQPSSTTATVKAPDPATKTSIDGGAFTYDKPVGWAVIASTALQTSGSITGIGLSAQPAVTFTARVVDSVPTSDASLKSETLAGLQKFGGFSLTSTSNVKVSGQAGQQFIYNFNGTSGLSTQQLVEVVYKQKTYMFLFQDTASDFGKQTSAFASILSSIKFK